MPPSSRCESWCIYIVDDDDSVRRGFRRLLRSFGYQIEVFANARSFLDADLERWGCVILDVQLPDLTGLDLQTALAERDIVLPVIFVSGYGTIPMTVQAMRGGAIDFLQKPVSEPVLRSAVERGLEEAARRCRQWHVTSQIQQRLNCLTPREKQVFRLAVTGKLNKQIAGELGTSEKTVKVHRARVMEKMRASTFAELVRMAERLGVGGEPR